MGGMNGALQKKPRAIRLSQLRKTTKNIILKTNKKLKLSEKMPNLYKI